MEARIKFDVKQMQYPCLQFLFLLSFFCFCFCFCSCFVCFLRKVKICFGFKSVNREVADYRTAGIFIRDTHYNSLNYESQFIECQ